MKFKKWINRYTILSVGILIVYLITMYQKNRQNIENNSAAQYQKSIETKITNTLSEEKKQEALTKNKEANLADIEFGKSLQDFYIKNPWYSKIPIETKDYTIIFDFEKNSFRIRLKVSKTSTEAVVKTLTDKALLSIKEIGAVPTNYYILYID